MATLKRWEGKTALITGASSGIGKAFATELAAAKCNLILTARRKGALEILGKELTSAHGITVDIIDFDISVPGSALGFFQQMKALQKEIDIFVSNAGFGISGDFCKCNFDLLQRMLQLNSVTPIELTRLILPEMIGRGSGNILFVEDDKAISEAIDSFLKMLGYDVTVCNNGLDALNLFKKDPQQFDLVITDQVMPIMTGKQLSQELLTIRPDVPIILSTGYSDVNTEEEAQEIGIRRYIMKPIELTSLSQTIKKCLKDMG